MKNKGLIGVFIVLLFLAIILISNPFTVMNTRSTTPTAAQEYDSNVETLATEKLDSRLTELSTLTTKEGTGDQQVQVGDNITVHYRGWLASDGTVFDSSGSRGKTGLTFTVGSGVIQGWSEGVVGMKVGEIRRIKIPSDLGYGADGRPPVIPGDSDLIFDVELLKIN